MGTAMTDSTLGQPSGQPRLRDALDRVRQELAALAEGELMPLNVDPLVATATARAAIPRLLEMRPRIEKALPEFELRYLDNLEIYALALMQSHGLYLCAKTPPEELELVASEAIQLRKRLLTDISTINQRKLICRKESTLRRGPPSYRDVVGDILTLSNLLRKHWETISLKCGVTLEELDRAEVLGDQMNKLLGSRERTPLLVAEAINERQRAFTLFANAYNQVRKAAFYLRWELGDVDKFAPALRPGKTGVRGKRPAAAAAPAPTIAASAEDIRPDPFVDTNYN